MVSSSSTINVTVQPTHPTAQIILPSGLLSKAKENLPRHSSFASNTKAPATACWSLGCSLARVSRNSVSSARKTILFDSKLCLHLTPRHTASLTPRFQASTHTSHKSRIVSKHLAEVNDHRYIRGPYSDQCHVSTSFGTVHSSMHVRIPTD